MDKRWRQSRIPGYQGAALPGYAGPGSRLSDNPEIFRKPRTIFRHQSSVTVPPSTQASKNNHRAAGTPMLTAFLYEPGVTVCLKASMACRMDSVIFGFSVATLVVSFRSLFRLKSCTSSPFTIIFQSLRRIAVPSFGS